MKLELPVNSEPLSNIRDDGKTRFSLSTNGGGCCCNPPQHVFDARWQVPVELETKPSGVPHYLHFLPNILGLRVFAGNTGPYGVQASLGRRFKYEIIGSTVEYVNMGVGEDGIMFLKNGGVSENLPCSWTDPKLQLGTLKSIPLLMVVRINKDVLVSFGAKTVVGRKIVQFHHNHDTGRVTLTDELSLS